MRWMEVDLDDPKARETAIARGAIVAGQDERSGLSHDLAWLSSGGATHGDRLVLYMCMEGDETLGYAPFLTRDAKLRLEVADKVLASVAIALLVIVGCPLFTREARTRERELVDALLDVLRSRLRGQRGLLFLGLRDDTVLFDLLTGGKARLKSFWILHHGAQYHRRLLALPDTYDAYLAGLGRKTREDLRRHHRKFFAMPDRKIVFKRYASPDSVGEFLRHANELSKRTYQWLQLGQGLSDLEKLGRSFRIAADHGWFCSYIIFCDDEPVAFMAGMLRDGVYYSDQIGYDPDFHKHSVGNVLHCEVVKDLIENMEAVRWFDFLYGDNDNKRRLSTTSRLEQNIYLLPNNAFGTVAYASLSTANAATSAISRLLDRYGLKQKIRTYLRRRAMRRDA